MGSKAKSMALGGILAALAVTVMILSGIFPMAAYCGPVLAAAMLVPVMEMSGAKMAWAWFGAVAVLSCLLCPNPECWALFLLLGYYPIIKGRMDRLRPGLLRFLVKTVFFNLAILLMAGLLALVMGVEALLAEAPWLLAASAALGNATFWMTDLLLTRITALVRRTIK